MLRVCLGAIAGFAVLAAPMVASAQTTLEKIKTRGQIVCGASLGVPGFSYPDDKGAWTGFDTDICRASVSYTHLTLPTTPYV